MDRVQWPKDARDICPRPAASHLTCGLCYNRVRRHLEGCESLAESARLESV